MYIVSPEASPVGGSEIVLTGDFITLTAFLPNFVGNPVPTISWTGPDGEARANGGRFNTSVLGQITIINITDSDNGTYTCTVSNVIPPDLLETVELVFAG